MGKPAEEWSYGDLDAGFKAAKLVIEESFVTAGYSHHSMEPRTAMAYWQGGKCFLYGSNQSHTAAVPNIARYIGIEPEDLVFIAEYCGGGFGSKIPGYPIMAIPALLSKKIGRPVMHAHHRASKNTAIGTRAAELPGPGQARLRARTASIAGRRSLHRAGDRPASSAPATSASAGNCLSLALSAGRHALSRHAGADQHAAARARSAGPARTSSCRRSSR